MGRPTTLLASRRTFSFTQTPEVLGAILERQPALQELVGNEWIILASKSPSTVALQRYCPRRGWLPWSGKAVLPQVVELTVVRHEAGAYQTLAGRKASSTREGL